MMHSFHLVSPEREYLTSNVLFMLLLIPCLFLYIHLTFGIPEMKLFVFLFAVTAVVKQWNISHQKDHEKDQSQKTKLPVFPLAEKAACGYELFLQQEYQWGRA